MENMESRRLEILRHSLGLSRESDRLSDDPYRNYFATTKDTVDYFVIESLMEDCLMSEGDADKEIFGDMMFFHVTDAGKDYVRQHQNHIPDAGKKVNQDAEN